MDPLYAYPLLKLLDDDTPLDVSISDDMSSCRRLTRSQQVLTILIALRELWNTRNMLNHDLTWDELDGCRFGLKAIQEILALPGCDSFSNANSVQVDQKIYDAIRSLDASKQMSEFMRWATDNIMEFLADRSRWTGSPAKSALIKLEKVKKCLLANTSKVDQYIQLNKSEADINSRKARMLQILTSLFRAVMKHHRKLSDSRIGVEELLLLAEETDFVDRCAKSHPTLHATFAAAAHKGYPMSRNLESMAWAIRDQIEKRGHPMPLEHAIKIVAPVVPRLTQDVIEPLPLHRWSRWFREVGLEEIGERLAADVDKQLLPKQRTVTPSPHTAPSAYNTAPTHQSSSVVSIASDLLREELDDPIDDNRSLVSHRTSLFASRDHTPQNTKVPAPTVATNQSMKSALPPIPQDQKRAQQSTDATQSTDSPAVKKPRTLPPSKSPLKSIVSDQGPRKGPAGKSKMYRANDLRLPIQRARPPLSFFGSRATSSGSDNGSEFTSGPVPTARIMNWQAAIQPSTDLNRTHEQRDHGIAGLDESANETIGRQRHTRPLKLRADMNTGLRLVARAVDRPQHSVAGSENEDSSDEDVEMNDDADGDRKNGTVDVEEESESEESEEE